MLAMPLSGAVQEYQIECARQSGPCAGSPASRVAPIVEHGKRKSFPLKTTRFEKASLFGEGPYHKSSVKAPSGLGNGVAAAPATLSWYSLPAMVSNRFVWPANANVTSSRSGR